MQRDKKINFQKILVFDRKEKKLDQKFWKDVKVGEIVKVMKDESFPADILLLSTSYQDGQCYVETSNLDG